MEALTIAFIAVLSLFIVATIVTVSILATRSDSNIPVTPEPSPEPSPEPTPEPTPTPLPDPSFTVLFDLQLENNDVIFVCVAFDAGNHLGVTLSFSPSDITKPGVIVFLISDDDGAPQIDLNASIQTPDDFFVDDNNDNCCIMTQNGNGDILAVVTGRSTLSHGVVLTFTYDRDIKDWSEPSIITRPDGTLANDGFGRSLTEIHTTTNQHLLCVGGAAGVVGDAGVVYVFQEGGSQWNFADVSLSDVNIVKFSAVMCGNNDTLVVGGTIGGANHYTWADGTFNVQETLATFGPSCIMSSENTLLSNIEPLILQPYTLSETNDFVTENTYTSTSNAVYTLQSNDSLQYIVGGTARYGTNTTPVFNRDPVTNIIATSFQDILLELDDGSIRSAYKSSVVVYSDSAYILGIRGDDTSKIAVFKTDFFNKSV
jgi:hypothetical protein